MMRLRAFVQVSAPMDSNSIATALRWCTEASCPSSSSRRSCSASAASGAIRRQSSCASRSFQSCVEPHVRHPHSCSSITDDGTDLHVRDIVSHRPGVNILASFANRVFPLRPHRKVSSCHGSILEEPLTHSQREDGTQRLTDHVLRRRPEEQQVRCTTAMDADHDEITLLLGRDP